MKPTSSTDFHFIEDTHGLMYIGPVSQFPENFMRQVYWCLVQKFGINQALIMMDREVSGYREASV